jgi:hypothetical protein
MRLVIGMLLVFSFVPAGCSTAPPSVTETCPAFPAISDLPPSPDDSEWLDKTEKSTLSFARQLEGFTEKAAESCVLAAGLTWRVIGRDGEMFAVTLDYSPRRVNAVIKESLVTDVSTG